MILIGQYDSSYVRRVGIALRLYAIPFEHRPWSIFGDAEQLQQVNPLIRVPTLILDDGESLIDLPPHKPHRLFHTRLGSLLWCSRHEMVHAGQIALLRRMIGRKPLW